VGRGDKPRLLAELVASLDMSRTIVFTRTKHGADRLVRQLHQSGIKSVAIHGNKTQNARQQALDQFQRGKVGLLVATDIASRGIDVDGITHVVNYDLTHEPETYVHRIGRTARAGASGAALSFCDAEERAYIRQIHKLTAQTIPVIEDHPFVSANGGLMQPANLRTEFSQKKPRPSGSTAKGSGKKWFGQRRFNKA